MILEIRAKSVLGDLCSGMGDTAIMEKHGLMKINIWTEVKYKDFQCTLLGLTTRTTVRCKDY